MDPDATLKYLVEKINEMCSTKDELIRGDALLNAEEALENLCDWLGGGGFSPKNKLTTEEK